MDAIGHDKAVAVCQNVNVAIVAPNQASIVLAYTVISVRTFSHVITHTLYSLRLITRFPQLSLLFLTLRTYVFSIHVCLRIITYIFPSMSLYV